MKTVMLVTYELCGRTGLRSSGFKTHQAGQPCRKGLDAYAFAQTQSQQV